MDRPGTSGEVSRHVGATQVPWRSGRSTPERASGSVTEGQANHARTSGPLRIYSRSAQGASARTNGVVHRNDGGVRVRRPATSSRREGGEATLSNHCDTWHRWAVATRRPEFVAFVRALSRLVWNDAVEAWDELQNATPSAKTYVETAAEALEVAGRDEFREIPDSHKTRILEALTRALENTHPTVLHGAAFRGPADLHKLLLDSVPHDVAFPAGAPDTYLEWVLEYTSQALLQDLAQTPATGGLVMAAVRELLRPPAGPGASPAMRDTADRAQLGRVAVATVEQRDALFAGARTLRSGYAYPAEVFASLDNGTFSGRGWLATEFHSLLRSQQSGYIILEAEGGLGKTAFLASLARENQWAHYFFRSGKRDTLERAIRSASAQLIAAWSLTSFSTFTPTDLGPSLFEEILAAASEARIAQAIDTEVVVVLDGLDESTGPTDEIAMLPHQLPPGIHIVISRRPSWRSLHVPHETLTLKSEDPRNLADVRLRVAVTAGKPMVAKQLEDQAIDPNWLGDVIVDRTRGLWVYIDHLLGEIESGRRALDQLDGLPSNLWDYYRNTLTSSREVDPVTWNQFELPILSVLAVAGETLTTAQLCGMARVPQTSAALHFVRNVVWGFLTVTYETDDPEAEPRVALYHRTVRDFLRGESGERWRERRDVLRELKDACARANRQIAEAYLTAWGGIHSGLPELGRETDALKNGYAARNVVHHMHAAGMDHEIAQLLAFDQPRDTGSRSAWECYLTEVGDEEALLRDLQTGVASARRTSDQASDSGAPSPVPAEIFATLARASLGGSVLRTPSRLLARLIAAKATSIPDVIEAWWQAEHHRSSTGGRAEPERGARSTQARLSELGAAAALDSTAFGVLIAVCECMPEELQRRTISELVDATPNADVGRRLRSLVERLGELPLDFLASAIARIGDEDERLESAATLLSRVKDPESILAGLTEEQRRTCLQRASKAGLYMPSEVVISLARSILQLPGPDGPRSFRALWRDYPGLRPELLSQLDETGDYWTKARVLAEVADLVPPSLRPAAARALDDTTGRPDSTRALLVKSIRLSWGHPWAVGLHVRGLLMELRGVTEPDVRAAVISNLAAHVGVDEEILVVDAALEIVDHSLDAPRRGPAGDIGTHSRQPVERGDPYADARMLAMSACASYLGHALRDEVVALIASTTDADAACIAASRLMVHSEPSTLRGLFSWLGRYSEARELAAEFQIASAGDALHLATLSERVLEYCAAEGDEGRARLLSLVAESRDPAVLTEAIGLATGLGLPARQAETMALLAKAAGACAPHAYIRAAARILDRDARGRAIDAIAPYLPEELISVAAESTEKIGDQASIFVALIAIGSLLSPAAKVDAARLASNHLRLLEPGPERVGALRLALALAPSYSEEDFFDSVSELFTPADLAAAFGEADRPLSDALCDRLFRTIESSRDDDDALRCFLSFASRVNRASLVSRGLQWVETIRSTGARGWALNRLGGAIDARQAERWLALVSELEDPGSKAFAISAGGRALRVQQSFAILEIVASLANGWQRAWSLARLAERLSDSHVGAMVRLLGDGTFPQLSCPFVRAFGHRFRRSHVRSLLEMAGTLSPEQWQEFAVEVFRRTPEGVVVALVQSAWALDPRLKGWIFAAAFTRRLCGDVDGASLAKTRLFRSFAGVELAALSPWRDRVDQWGALAFWMYEVRSRETESAGGRLVTSATGGEAAQAVREAARHEVSGVEGEDLATPSDGAPAEASGDSVAWMTVAQVEEALVDIDTVGGRRTLGAERSPRDEAIVRLARQIGTSAIPRFLRSVDTLGNDDARFEAICGFVDRLDVRHSSLLLDSIRRIAKPGARGWALRVAAEHIGSDVLDRALDLVDQIEDDGSRAYALEAYLSQLGSSAWPRAIAMASGVRASGPRSWLLERSVIQAPPELAPLLIRACPGWQDWDGLESAIRRLFSLVPVDKRLALAIEVRGAGVSLSPDDASLGWLSAAPRGSALGEFRSIADRATRPEILSTLVVLSPDLASTGGEGFVVGAIEAIERCAKWQS